MTMSTFQIGSTTIAAPNDLWSLLGVSVNSDGTVYDGSLYREPTRLLVEALSDGLTGEAAVLRAVALASNRRAAQSLETARQKVAEAESARARDERIAAGMTLKARKIESDL